LRRFDEADAALSAADDAFSTLQSAGGLARVRLRQGELALARGEPAPARGLLEEALRLLADRPAEAAVARQHLAALALASADLERAEQLLEAAIVTAEQAGLTPLLADLLHLRAKLWSAQQKPHLAMSDLRSAVATVERVRGSLQADRLRSAFVESRTAVYEDLVAALLDSDEPARTAEAFAVVEQAKSRALLDLVAGAVASASLLPESAGNGAAARLVQQVVQARGDLNALYSRIVESDAAVRAGWTQEVEACERRLQTLESRLAVARGLGGLFAAPVDLAAVQRLLGPDTALLEYFIAGEEVIAFVVRGDRAAVFRHLVSRAVLADHVELVRFQIERAVTYQARQVLADARLLADAQRELADLHAFLVEPLAEVLAGVKRLVVVPHGPLHAIPFHALFDGERYLIESFEMTYAPSASLMRHLDTGGAVASDRAARGLILGVADDAAPRIEAEVRAVAASLAAARTFVGPEATWPRLSREAPAADVVHLACHGRFTPDRPLSSGVKLGDRWMTVRDLYGLKLAGAVVVLSGCDTGRTVVGGGDDLVGLVRGFFAAGASALLMTLWPLHDETAENLVASIYNLWHNAGKEAGAAPNLAAAVQTAQRRLLEAHPHPVFWAPFVLVGGR
jgi:CHAT domain-containing protein